MFVVDFAISINSAITSIESIRSDSNNNANKKYDTDLSDMQWNMISDLFVNGNYGKSFVYTRDGKCSNVFS